ncbi:hypothetical protein A3860_14995 [Niastella vici]|uniref:Uncharacterized protein n=1 Tax=Niastella vici TaxID=1703345 RepID=A0A1V9G5N8_9BACT|nr:hypothetical protein [Niastella vici]OQP65897.1 hypothetical protein A3860_14995 [Niastella vici]
MIILHENTNMNPEMPAPAFSLKGMKRAFYVFVTFNVIIAITALVMYFVFEPTGNYNVLGATNPWYLVVMYAAFGIINYFSSKKVTKFIRETADPIKRFSKYESFYKKKTIANAFACATTLVLFIITGKYTFLYLLGLQMIIPVMLYPRKKMLSALFEEGVQFS